MEHLLRLLEDNGLHFVEGPGRSYGGYEPTTATIRVAPGLTARATCSVLAHELAHAVLGHTPTADAELRARQERRADEWAARLLITAPAYAEAERLRGTHLASMAFELGVTVEIVAAYRRLLLRIGDTTYVGARMGNGQWDERALSA
ncbi:ImmA/IrrE family metallo-endopeptidase [Microbacterium sp. ANT_H45B]|uniref:ImmA/IrrE family metallo-endopeptidase n=1 Tax=Microbacterium TaxID=33882 RepID=UPI0011ED9B20|nr:MULTISPECIES: ImmA/IrrE family metallo-endopeptidase [Microbacterium]KAA0959517.1 ImmA/IrrE family metallo-endopeptidase [Microbacterium sp. ANT_H45B]